MIKPSTDRDLLASTLGRGQVLLHLRQHFLLVLQKGLALDVIQHEPGNKMERSTMDVSVHNLVTLL